MNRIWFYMIAIGIVGSLLIGNIESLNLVLISEASNAIEFTLSLAGIMAFWMGIMNVANDAGLIKKLGEILNPLMRKLFKGIPKGHKALDYIVMNISLNALGAGNGATAFGLKAMEELQTLNKDKNIASNDMIMFLVINISSVQIVPFTMLKIRMEMGSVNPSEIIVTTLLSTLISTIVAVTTCKMFERSGKC